MTQKLVHATHLLRTTGLEKWRTPLHCNLFTFLQCCCSCYFPYHANEIISIKSRFIFCLLLYLRKCKQLDYSSFVQWGNAFKQGFSTCGTRDLPYLCSLKARSLDLLWFVNIIKMVLMINRYVILMVHNLCFQCPSNCSLLKILEYLSYFVDYRVFIRVILRMSSFSSAQLFWLSLVFSECLKI